MDRLDAMTTFVRVVDTGSVSAAAEYLEVAKSAVSRRLRDLEAHLGAELLRRTTRRLTLTETGRAYYERCVRILADVTEAEDAVSSQHGELAGRLRVAAPLSFGLLHLQPAIDDFLATHPRVQFDLDLNDREVDLVAEGFDVGVRIAQLPDSSLIARRLAPIRAIACAGPDYLDRKGVPSDPQELTQHECLVYSNLQEPAVWRYVDGNGQKRRVHVRARLSANNGDFIRQAAVAGNGIILSPTFIVYRDIAEGRLVPILEDTEWPVLQTYALYPQTRHLSARVRAFVDFLVVRFAGEPYWDAHIQGARAVA